MKSSRTLTKSLRNYKVARHRPKIWILPADDMGYVKITKVASSSVELALAKHITRQETGREPTDLSNKDIRQCADQYAVHANLKDLPSDIRPKLLFSIVRNPLARLHSSYVNKIEDVRNAGGQENIFWNHDISLDMSFEEFIERLIEIPDRRIDRHLRSQASILCDGDKILVDYIGHFENLGEDWQFIADQYGLPRLPHKNKSSKSTESAQASPYTKKTALLVADRFQQDIEALGYADQVQQLIDQLT